MVKEPESREQAQNAWRRGTDLEEVINPQLWWKTVWKLQAILGSDQAGLGNKELKSSLLNSMVANPIYLSTHEEE